MLGTALSIAIWERFAGARHPLGEILRCGGADVVQKRLPQNVLTKTFFRGLDIYLSSDDLSVGSNRQSKYKANANYEFKTKVLNVLTKEKYENRTKKVLIEMRYTDLADIGGFLWWLLIKFCKTNLKEEQTKSKWSRNIFVFLVFGILIGFIVSVFT